MCCTSVVLHTCMLMGLYRDIIIIIWKETPGSALQESWTGSHRRIFCEDWYTPTEALQCSAELEPAACFVVSILRHVLKNIYAVVFATSCESLQQGLRLKFFVELKYAICSQTTNLSALLSCHSLSFSWRRSNHLLLCLGTCISEICFFWKWTPRRLSQRLRRKVWSSTASTKSPAYESFLLCNRWQTCMQDINIHDPRFLGADVWTVIETMVSLDAGGHKWAITWSVMTDLMQ